MVCVCDERGATGLKVERSSESGFRNIFRGGKMIKKWLWEHLLVHKYVSDWSYRTTF